MKRWNAHSKDERSGFDASPRAGATRRTVERKAHRDESGDTLIEILIALVVLGTASVALIIAFGTSISASAEHRQLSASGIALDSISQQVIADMQATPSLFECPYVFSNYEAATFGAPVGSTNYINVPANFVAAFDTSNAYPVEYWDTTTNSFSTGDPASTGSCAAGQPQLVTITVTDTQTNDAYNNSFVVDSPLDTVSGSGPSASYGTAEQLVFTTNPGTSTTGNSLPTPVPAVTVEDSNGNTVVDDLSPVLLSLVEPGGGVVTSGAELSGCSSLELNGVVTFTGCSVSVQGTYELAATDGDFAGTFYSEPFTVTQATDYLAFSTQPVAGLSGSSLTTNPTITVYNSTTNQVDKSWTGAVTLNASGGSLTGCSAITFTTSMKGVGSFSGCNFAGSYYVNLASGATLATPYTLTATPSNNAITTSPATSQAFEVTGPGTPTQLVFSTQPTGSASASFPAAFATEPVVALEDSFGNIVTSSSSAVPVTLSISNGSLNNCASNPLTTSSGSASFSGCGGSGYGVGITLTASSNGLTSATSAVFNITSAASQLIFTSQPAASTSGIALKPQPVITVKDATGRTVTAATGAATLTSVTTGDVPAGILQFCTGLTPFEGVITVQTCTFSGLVGTPYYLDVTQGGLSATSAVFSPTAAGTPTQLVFNAEPVAGAAGSPFTVQPVVDIEDAGGNIVTTSTASISLASSGGTLSGCSNLTAVAGVVNVTGCTFGGLDTQSYELTATSSGLTSGTSSGFTPSGPGPVSATLSLVVANPLIVQANGTATSAITVTLEDAYTNVISGKSVMLAQGATNSVIAVNPLTTGSNGTAVFSASDTHQEIATYSASDVTDSVVLGSQVQVSFATLLLAPTNVVLSYGSTQGSLGVTFTGPSNAPSGQLYTAEGCTNSAMTANCSTPQSITSGGQFTGLSYTQGSAGTSYYVTVTATASSGYLAATSSTAGPQADTSQVNAPTNVAVTASTTTAGALKITFTNSTGAAPSSYSAIACTSPTMASGCNGPVAITSGGQVSGLISGTAYFVGVVANGPTGYASAESTIVGPYTTTAQLNYPTNVTLSYGSTAGSIGVSFINSVGAPSGQTYTVVACTNSGMTTACTSSSNFTSGGQITGLTYTQGSAGTAYYVTVTANASSGYLAATSSVAGPQNATSQVNAPTGVVLAPSATKAGAILVTFNATTGVTPTSYTVIACTNTAMNSGCVTATNFSSANQIAGLVPGTAYYVTVTAVTPSSAYVSATTAYVGPTTATIQLNAPAGVTLSAGTVPGSLKVTFTASSNAPVGQTYTAVACTNSGMTTNCIAPETITSGGQITGLTQGTAYYATISAVASTGYLGATSAASSSAAVASYQIGTVAAPTLSYGTTAGSLTVTFATPTNAAPGQTYAATACTGAGMTGTCVNQSSITSGGQLTGLAYTQGSAGTAYYVTVTANASSGYVASTSSVGGPQADTSQVNAPTNVNAQSSTTAAGSIFVTYTASTGVAPASYTLNYCTNTNMTTGCATKTAYTSGTAITSLAAGTTYYATVTAVAPSSAYLAATSAQDNALATVQLNAPTGVSLAAGTTSGSLAVTFTASTNAPVGQTYSAEACTGAGMTGTCVNQSSITSGGQLTGLVGTTKTNYYVTVSAVASTGYLAATSSAAGPTAATVQLNAPAIVSLSSGTTAGSLTVTFTAPTNAPTGQTYTAEACTGSGMTGTCVNQSSITSGGQLTGLAYTQGSAGTAYYVTVTATNSAGYLAAASAQVGPQADTSQVNAPTNVNAQSSTTAAGSIFVTYTASTGVAPASYTLNYCTNTNMTTGCATKTAYTSGTAITSLAAGTTYYATVTAVAPSSAYLAATSAQDNALATVQLNAPTGVSLAAGTTSGSLAVTFTASTNAPVGQTYSAEACTGAGMTGTCVNQSSITSGGQLTGLVGTTKTNYYVTVSAVASTGYLAATSSAAGPTAATVQLNAPASLAVAASSGQFSVSFTAPTNAPTGQTYTAEACTGSGLTGCKLGAAVTGTTATVTGLSNSTNYYVAIIANSSTGYLQSVGQATGTHKP